MVAYLNKQLEKHGKKYIAGDKLTTADFKVASLVFSHIYNDALPGGAAFTDKGKAVVAEHKHFAEYVETLRTELAGYLTSRPPAPF